MAGTSESAFISSRLEKGLQVRLAAEERSVVSNSVSWRETLGGAQRCVVSLSMTRQKGGIPR